MELLQTGQKLSINIQKEDKLVEIMATITGIEEDRLKIELPPYFMRYIKYLGVGRKLTLKVFSKLGTIDFNAIVINSPLEDDFCVELDENAIKLTPNEDIPVVGAMESLVITKGDMVLNAKTIELSTEYLKFYTDKKFEINDTFDCELIFPNGYGTITFRGTVTEIDEVYDNEYKVSYSNMTEYDRQTLLYYMYVYVNDLNQD